jgi:deoxyribonuclease V
LTHRWNLSVSEAATLQRALATRVVSKDGFNAIRFIAGVDVACDSRRNHLHAAVVVLDAHSLATVETAHARKRATFPYIPGLLAFRELPVVVKALKRLNAPADLIVCDGQGLAHPRRFGIASHLGVLFNVPAIGCSKTRYIGTAHEPGVEKGARAPLEQDGERIGCVLRTRAHTRPVYVSVGHLISLPTACDWIVRLSPRYRLPETTRRADRLARTLSQTAGD